MKKVAVIIKHRYRDYDYRVDLYEVSEDSTEEDILKYAQSKMLGPFDVIAITTKVDINCKMS